MAAVRLWEGTLATCFHPIADRYENTHHTEKCGWCGDVRFVRDRDKTWAPVSRRDGSIRQPAGDRSRPSEMQSRDSGSQVT